MRRCLQGPSQRTADLTWHVLRASVCACACVYMCVLLVGVYATGSRIDGRLTSHRRAFHCIRALPKRSPGRTPSPPLVYSSLPNILFSALCAAKCLKEKQLPRCSLVCSAGRLVEALGHCRQVLSIYEDDEVVEKHTIPGHNAYTTCT